MHPGSRRTMRSGAHGPLEQSVRRLFLGFVFLLLLVEAVEWLDASTPWWPHRAVAAISLSAAGLWATVTYRRERAYVHLDLLCLLSMIGTGWGLGRPGAVIALLLGVVTLRVLYGSRRSVGWFTAGVLASYYTVVVLVSGSDGLADLGNVTIFTASMALVGVFRPLGEAMARHDRSGAWDTVLTDTAGALLAATTTRQVLDVVDRAVRALLSATPGSNGSLWLGDTRQVARVSPVPSGVDELPSRVDLAAVPAEVRDRLLGGKAVMLAGSPAAALRESLGRRPLEGGVQIAPVSWEGEFRGALVVGASGPLPVDLLRVIRRLAADVGLTLERIYSERRFRLLTESSRDGIYLLQLRPTVEFQYVNPALERLLGVSAEALCEDPGRRDELIHPDDLRVLVQHRRGGGDEAVALRVRHADGWRWVEVTESPVVDGEQVLTVQGVVRDVTRQREQAAALQHALEQEQQAAEALRHVDDMKSAFLQAVSHELRTPLTAVIGGARTLEMRDDLDADARRRLVQLVTRNAARLQRLLTDLLDVDRLTRGIVTPNRIPTDLVTLTHQVLDAMDGRARDVQVAATPVTIRVDAPKVERVVDNLVRNALKHTPAGTPVTVRVEPHGDGARIAVEDAGPGVPDELKHLLFEPFAQGPQSSTAPSPGTGIGLALVQRLVELHEGEAWIEDREGGGARFVVHLPDLEPDADEGPAGPPRPDSGAQPSSNGDQSSLGGGNRPSRMSTQVGQTG